MAAGAIVVAAIFAGAYLLVSGMVVVMAFSLRISGAQLSAIM